MVAFQGDVVKEGKEARPKKSRFYATRLLLIVAYCICQIIRYCIGTIQVVKRNP